MQRLLRHPRPVARPVFLNRLGALAAIFLLTGCARGAPAPSPAPAPGATSDSARFEQFISSYLEGDFRPQQNRDDPLASLRPEADRAEVAAAHEALGALRAIDTLRLSVQQRIDWLLLEASEKRTLHDTMLRSAERTPGRYITLGGIYWQIGADAEPTADDWESVLRTLERAPEALAIGRERLHAPPPLWVDLAVSTAEGYVRFLDGEYRTLIAGAPAALRERLGAAGIDAAAALRGYVAYLRETLEPGGATSWAAGAAYYDWVLREVNFLPYTAESMIAEGRRIHEATKRALDSLARSIDSTKSWRQLVDDMQTRHPDPGKILAAYEQESHRVLGFLITHDLIRIPPCQELLYVPTAPQNRETYAWGGYGGLRERDGVLYGRFFVTDVVPGMSEQEVHDKLRAQNNGWVSVIALHEGYPGHHLQQVYARGHDRPVRRRFGNTYFGEGWALYAEHWMRRAGLFVTDDQKLAQLQMRLWRTARVIIDPSLHTGRMSYDDAVTFFMDEVGLTRSAAEAEVNRYTTWPTQAPSYIIGWLEIERLEQELRRAEGDRFDAKRFRERLLEQGSLPLALMRRAMIAR
jgi:uncharacterized protein (DUF885 family)